MILILGSTGLLGLALIEFFQEKNIQNVCGLARKNSDFNIDIIDHDKLIAFLNKLKPKVIINSIAIVDHQLCEDKPDLAYLVNSRIVGIISDWSLKNSCYFIQISTDHYYVGDGSKKHSEKDQITLVNEYAKTKYLGEVLALINPQSLVIRTNIVGFKNHSKPTFLEWVLQSLKNNQQINLFNDYFTSSIHTNQLAKIIYDLIDLKLTGVINIASSSVSSKEQFILALAKKFNFNLNNAKSISIFDSNIIKRAESLGLETAKIESILGYNMPDINEVIDSIHQDYLTKKIKI